MRLWHHELLEYLPDRQFRGQLRELVSIIRDLRVNHVTNHLLINLVMGYPERDLLEYALKYDKLYRNKYNKTSAALSLEIEWLKEKSANQPKNDIIFEGWHNEEYLRVCMANLYEKANFGIGRSRLTAIEWSDLLCGYKKITGNQYKI